MSILRPQPVRSRQERALAANGQRPQEAAIPLGGERWRPEVLRISRLRDEAEAQLVTRIHARLAATLGRAIDTGAPESVRALLYEQFPIALDDEKVALARTDRMRLQEAVLAEVMGYGPIQDVLNDDDISEVMVNGPRQVWIERAGQLYLTDISFTDADHVLRIIQRIVMRDEHGLILQAG